jgi:hypothetical protein
VRVFHSTLLRALRRVDGRSQPPKALAASFATCHSGPRTLAHYVEKRCARFPPYAPASHVGWVAEASHRKPRPPASPPATRARAPSPTAWKSAARVFHPTLLRAAWGGWPKPATESPGRQLRHLPLEPAHPHHYVEKRRAHFPPYAPASHVGWMAEASHRTPWPPALPPATRARAPSPITWKSAARVFHPTLQRAT